MTYTPKHILVTGGAGFIGANFIACLLRQDPDCVIHNIDKLTYAGSLDNLADFQASARHHFYQQDICEQSFVEDLLRRQGIDTLVHFAAESHVDRSIAGPAEFIQTNLLGTFSLLEAARKVWLEERKLTADTCRFHHISTDEVYGTLDRADAAFTETTPYAPNSPYSASKAGSDHLARAYHHTYGLPVTTSNCSNNYGPRQHAEKLIPTIIRCCLAGQTIPIYGDGSNIRDWLYVDDHCHAIDKILHVGTPGETYNIGADEERNNLDIARTICKILAELLHRDESEFTALIRFVKDRPGHDWRYAINATKIRETLGWRPQHTFENGIRKTIQWYLARNDFVKS